MRMRRFIVVLGASLQVLGVAHAQQTPPLSPPLGTAPRSMPSPRGIGVAGPTLTPPRPGQPTTLMPQPPKEGDAAMMPMSNGSAKAAPAPIPAPPGVSLAPVPNGQP